MVIVHCGFSLAAPERLVEIIATKTTRKLTKTLVAKKGNLMVKTNKPFTLSLTCNAKGWPQRPELRLVKYIGSRRSQDMNMDSGMVLRSTLSGESLQVNESVDLSKISRRTFACYRCLAALGSHSQSQIVCVKKFCKFDGKKERKKQFPRDFICMHFIHAKQFGSRDTEFPSIRKITTVVRAQPQTLF